MTLDRPTVLAVAQHAGVSVASVSRVLNGLPSSPQMADRVRDAVAELGYRPLAAARSLKVRRTDQLALVVADVGNPVYVAMMRAVEARARAAGYRVVLSSAGSDPVALLEVLRGLAHGYVDGVVVSPLRVTDELLAELQALSVPVVVIGTIPPEVPLDVVRADSAAGVRLALEHLHAQGRRRVAFVNGPVDTVPGSARSAAVARTAQELGLPVTPRLRAVADDFTLEAGRAAADRLLDELEAAGEPPPDAVLGGNDLLAIAAMQSLQERGRRVPADVAVVGMDDTGLATVTSPTLTSVGLGSTERGARAADLLLARLTHPDRPPQRVVVPPHLVVRASSAVPGAPR
jgi:LacI family transcriptional regulator